MLFICYLYLGFLSSGQVIPHGWPPWPAPSAPRLHASLPKPPPMQLRCQGDATHGPGILMSLSMTFLGKLTCGKVMFHVR